MSKETDRFRGYIANEVLGIADCFGLDAGLFLYADGLSGRPRGPGDYSLQEIHADLELLAQRARQVETHAEVICTYVRDISAILGLEQEVDLRARTVKPGEYTSDDVVADMAVLEVHAKAARQRVEALERERQLGAVAAGLLGVLMGEMNQQ